MSSPHTPQSYLDQIAAKPARKSPFRSRLGLIFTIGAVLVVLVIALVIIANVISANRKEPWQQLSARLATTGTIATDAASKLKSSQLRSLNSELKLTITNTERDLAKPLVTVGVDATKLPASITTQESGAALLAALEEGRLNAVYDRTYAREMSYQLSSLLSLLQKIYAGSNDASLQSFLKTSYDNLSPIQQSISDFSASNN